MAMHLKPPKEYIEKPAYAFCATLIQILDEDTAIQRLRELGHVNNKNEEFARRRLQLSKNWIESYADESYKLIMLTKEENTKVKEKLENNVKQALELFTHELDKNEDEQVKAIKEICKDNQIKLGDFFKGAYQCITGKDKGPRLIPFINSMDKEKVKLLFSSKE